MEYTGSNSEAIDIAFCTKFDKAIDYKKRLLIGDRDKFYLKGNSYALLYYSEDFLEIDLDECYEHIYEYFKHTISFKRDDNPGWVTMLPLIISLTKSGEDDHEEFIEVDFSKELIAKLVDRNEKLINLLMKK